MKQQLKRFSMILLCSLLIASVFQFEVNYNQRVTAMENSCSSAKTWSETTVYVGGDQVKYDNQLYEAKWWTQGETPDINTDWGVWKLLGDCESDDNGNGDDDNGDTDKEAPTIPTNLSVTNRTTNSISLQWDASTDNIDVDSYIVHYDSITIETKNTNITISNLKENSAYTFTVQARDAAGNLSEHSEPVTTSTKTSEPIRCSVAEWYTSTVYNGGDRVSYNGAIYEANWWTQGDRPDESGEWGAWTFIEACETDDEDEEPPTTPENVKVTNKTATSVSLSWDAATDNVGVTSYEIYEKDSLIKTETNTSTTIRGLSPDTTYVFSVKAKDAAGNTSASSVAITVTTDEGDDNNIPDRDRMYVTYASTWNTSLYDLTTDNIPNYITHLNLSFIRPNTQYEKGSLDFDQEITGFEFVEGAATPNGQKKLTNEEKADLVHLIDELKNRGTEVWISVGGWAYSQGSEWSQFNAKNIVDLAVDIGASGVDIDWESSGSSCNKAIASEFRCSKDTEVANIITDLHDEINAQNADVGISIAGWSTGAYYVKDTPFEEGKVQWGSPYGGTMYRLVADHGEKIDFINLMSYDGGVYYDPREGYESYRAIYDGPINVGLQIAPEGSGGAVLKLNAEPGTVYDAEMLDGVNRVTEKYYNVETLVDYIKYKGQYNDGFMLWQLWKQRVHSPAPGDAATENSASQYICENLPLQGDCSEEIPDLPKLTP